MLEKMFPKNDAKVPEVRFSDFTDAWEQRHLGEIVERVTRKNENLESTLPLTISAQYGLIDQNEFFDKRIASKDVSLVAIFLLEGVNLHTTRALRQMHLGERLNVWNGTKMEYYLHFILFLG